jgi:peptidase C25-like protein
MPGNQAVMNQQLYRLLFDSSLNDSLGDLTMRAKAATPDPDIRRTWVLFGDPSMKLK